MKYPFATYPVGSRALIMIQNYNEAQMTSIDFSSIYAFVRKQLASLFEEP